MKPFLSNLSPLFIVFFVTSCQMGLPSFNQFIVQPNLLKEDNGEISEFLSLRIGVSSGNDNGRVSWAQFNAPTDELYWPLVPDSPGSTTYTYSFVQGPNAKLPRGNYIVELTDAFGHKATRNWLFKPLLAEEQDLVFPTQETLASINTEVFMFVYHNNNFVAEHLLTANEQIPSLLEGEQAYLYYYDEEIGYGLMQQVKQS